MKICCKLFSTLLSVRYLAAIAAFALFLPLTANAGNVEVWELDNWFSVAGGTSPDGEVTVINIKAGDTITFSNKGATDHDAVNDVVDYNGDTFFETDLFKGAVQSPGDSFTTEPFPVAGEIPFFCQIHGKPDMVGIIKVSGDGDDDGGNPPPPEGKSFTFKCNHTFSLGPAGLETLVMDSGASESCILKLTDLAPDTIIEIGTLVRSGFRSSISVDPISSMTNADGELEITITATGKGIDWIAWAIPNDKGEFVFNKSAYDNGFAWGMFVEVK